MGKARKVRTTFRKSKNPTGKVAMRRTSRGGGRA